MTTREPLLDAGRMRLLREVGLRGSIASAARELGLTPSAVSQQLAAFEREVGVALIDRSHRGVALTGAGHVLATRAAELVDVLAAARADLDRITGSVGGPVSVSAVASAAATMVSAAAAQLRVRHPAIELSVRAAEPRQAFTALVAGDVDVAVVDEYDYVPLALPEFVVARELCDEPLVVVLPEHRNGRRGVELSDLRDEDWVMPPDDAACGQAVRAACRAQGFEPRVRWETDDMHLLVCAVAAGHGVAVLPRRSVAVAGAPVCVRTLRAPQLQRRLFAVTRTAALARPAVEEVLAAIAAAA